VPARFTGSKLLFFAAAGAMLVLVGAATWWARGAIEGLIAADGAPGPRGAPGSLTSFLIAGSAALVCSFALLLWLAHRAFATPLNELHETTRAETNHRESLVKVGTLAAGIAHEVRNPLTAMKARCFALKELVPAGSKAFGHCEVVEGEINRLDRMIRDMLEFTRPREPALEDVPLAGFIARVAELVRSDLEDRGIRFDCLPTPDSLHARIDADQIEQVILNLARNAAESCPPEGGLVSLECGPHGNGVRISVADNGAGIPAEYHGKIFDPFFSRKPGGTGLGLSISQNIVRNHGGDLSFETEEGKGTVFHLDLNPSP
jgi:signal transduction histidine kinase